MTKGTLERWTAADGAEIGVYHMEPTGARRGGLVLIQEIFGVTPHIRALCDGYAAEGYEVLSPALYDRIAPGLEADYSEAGIAEAIAVRDKHPMGQSLADVALCVERLAPKGPVFMTGYCYGGSVTWMAAAQVSGIAAAACYYGRLIVDHTDEAPRCPIILHFGETDASIPLERVEALRAAQPELPIYVYPAGHGFNSDRRADYHEPSAKLALERTLALFRANEG